MLHAPDTSPRWLHHGYVAATHAPGACAETTLEQAQIIPASDPGVCWLRLSLTLDDCPATVGVTLDRRIGPTNLRGHPMFDAAAGSPTAR